MNTRIALDTMGLARMEESSRVAGRVVNAPVR